VTKGRISKIVAGLGSFRRLSIDHPFHIQQVMGQEHTQAQQPILNPYLQSGPKPFLSLASFFSVSVMFSLGGARPLLRARIGVHTLETRRPSLGSL